MAYIKKPTEGSQIIVSAILTKAGRQKLASGLDKFKIVKFAVADDQVDYTTEDLETVHYPVLQPIANGQLMMNYKLYTDYSVNAGSNILVKVLIDGLYTDTINSISSSLAGQVTYAPISQGFKGTQLYTFDLQFESSQNPFSEITYTTADGLKAQVPTTSKNISISNARNIIFKKKLLYFDSQFRMKITGASTGAFSYYNFVVKRDPTSGGTTGGER